MTDNNETLPNRQLLKYLRQLSKGDYLFKQGDLGHTLYIITEGAIQLMREVDQRSVPVHLAKTGEVLCEKAILKAGVYSRRTVSAIAQSSTTILEFEPQDLGMIQQHFPSFMSRLVQILSDRLSQANELISLLKADNPIEKFIQSILYFARFHSVKTARGLEVFMSIQDICDTLNLEKTVVEKLIGPLLSHEILLPCENHFILSNESELKNSRAIFKEI